MNRNYYTLLHMEQQIISQIAWTKYAIVRARYPYDSEAARALRLNKLQELTDRQARIRQALSVCKARNRTHTLLLISTGLSVVGVPHSICFFQKKIFIHSNKKLPCKK